MEGFFCSRLHSPLLGAHYLEPSTALHFCHGGKGFLRDGAR